MLKRDHKEHKTNNISNYLELENYNRKKKN